MIRFILSLVVCFVFTCASSDAFLIRDSEIEDTLRDILNPILEVSGLGRGSIELYVIQDKTMNAFATFDRKIFINTGLILKAELPEHIAGVMAHETGHIACEHLIRHIGMAEQSNILSTVLMIAGIGLGAATGSAELAMGGIAGGMTLGANTFFYHSRAEEEAADNKAMEYMEKLGLSAKGLLEITEVLAFSSRLNFDKKNGMPTTHPDIDERVAYLRSRTQDFKTSKPSKVNPKYAEINNRYKRIKVKIEAYLMPIEKVLIKYPYGDDSIESLYARAIALNRRGDFKESMMCINALVKRFPNDPYFLEMKGQILYENAKMREAIDIYRKLAYERPRDVLINLSLANILIKSDNLNYLSEAEKILYKVLANNPDELLAFQLLSMVYGKKGDYGMSALMSAEIYLLKEDKNNATRQAKRAIKYGLKSPVNLRRANDIINGDKPIKARKNKK